VEGVEVYILKEGFLAGLNEDKVRPILKRAEPSRKRWPRSDRFSRNSEGGSDEGTDRQRHSRSSVQAPRSHRPGRRDPCRAFGWQMSKLTINYNQLELIPQDLPSVLATKRMFKLAGGYGNLFVALGGKDVSQMKRVADDLTAEIMKIPRSAPPPAARTSASFVIISPITSIPTI